MTKKECKQERRIWDRYTETCCNTGETWDSDNEKCTSDIIEDEIECEDGTTLNEATGLCEETIPVPIECEAGQTLNETTQECEDDKDKPDPKKECEAGQKLDASTGTCKNKTKKECKEDGQKWNVETKKCTPVTIVKTPEEVCIAAGKIWDADN